MSEPHEPEADKMPDDEELQKPSAEKEPGEEPKTADPEPDEASHQAVGIGVIGSPDSGDDSSDEQGSPPHPTAAETAKSDSAPPTDAVTDEVKSDAVSVEDSEGSTAP